MPSRSTTPSTVASKLVTMHHPARRRLIIFPQKVDTESSQKQIVFGDEVFENDPPPKKWTPS